MSSSQRLFSGAAERNRKPIIEALRPRLVQWQSKSGKGKKASVLEVACGSGQHAAYLARHLGDCVGRWYPTDLGMNEDKRKSIAEWAREEGASEVVQKATELDTRTKFWGDNWKSKEIDHIFLANMVSTSTSKKHFFCFVFVLLVLTFCSFPFSLRSLTFPPGRALLA